MNAPVALKNRRDRMHRLGIGTSIGLQTGRHGFDARYHQAPSENTEYVLVKLVGPKVLWVESRVQGTGEYYPPLQFHAKIVEVEIGVVAIYRPFGDFAELIRTVTCMVLKDKANDMRTSSPLPR
ncbi:hypothetical protein TNCV_3484931 [Trichonephila clavipes]|nr:hypothetical protein TNCV_3484931 [Trichonephila clavipes]